MNDGVGYYLRGDQTVVEAELPKSSTRPGRLPELLIIRASDRNDSVRRASDANQSKVGQNLSSHRFCAFLSVSLSSCTSYYCSSPIICFWMSRFDSSVGRSRTAAAAASSITYIQQTELRRDDLRRRAAIENDDIVERTPTLMKPIDVSCFVRQA